MMYCHTHDKHYDSDFFTECPKCEDEPKPFIEDSDTQEADYERNHQHDEIHQGFN